MQETTIVDALDWNTVSPAERLVVAVLHDVEDDVSARSVPQQHFVDANVIVLQRNLTLLHLVKAEEGRVLNARNLKIQEKRSEVQYCEVF